MNTTKLKVAAATIITCAIIAVGSIASAHHTTVTCQSPGVWLIVNSEADKDMTFTTDQGHEGTILAGGSTTVEYSGTSLIVYGVWENGATNTTTGEGACTTTTTSTTLSPTTTVTPTTTTVPVTDPSTTTPTTTTPSETTVPVTPTVAPTTTSTGATTTTPVSTIAPMPTTPVSNVAPTPVVAPEQTLPATR